MKKINYLLISLILFSSLLCSSFSGFAQKLPKVQQAGVWAKTHLNYDEKMPKSSTFKAYNPSSRVYYTLANDNDNLFLLLTSDGSISAQKLVHGVTFTITPTEQTGNVKTKTTGNRTITYPTISNTQQTEDLLNIVRVSYISDTALVENKKVDSLSALANIKIAQLFKLIAVEGILEINSKILSIYNNEGIMASIKFNKKMDCIYKLTIPLKYLGISLNDSNSLKYRIKLNGTPEVGANGVGKVKFRNPGQVLPPESLYIGFPTDFSGEYTLAKQP